MNRASAFVYKSQIQDIEKGTSAAQFVRHLHTQADAPVLLVCAGLGNSRDRLEDGVLTRPASEHVISLGPLESEETLDGARRALRLIEEKTGIVNSGLTDSLATRIARASDNWPRHLTCYLRSVCEALMAQAAPAFDRLDIESAIGKGSFHRQMYYEDRLSSSKLPAGILADVYEQIQEASVLRSKCEAIFEKHIQELEGYEGALLRRTFASGEEAFGQALKSGLITTNRDRSCAIPIPSMRAFIMEKCLEEQRHSLER